MKKIIFFILTVVFCSTSLSAQKIFTLEECKMMGLENNNKTKNANLSLKAAQQGKKEAFTHYFPSLNASGLGFKAKDPMLSTTLGDMHIGLLDDGMVGAVTLTQPVFTGGKIYYGNKLANIGTEVSQQQIRLSENEVVLKIEELYWQLVSLYEKEKTLNVLEKQLQVLLNDVEASYNAGFITMNDVLQVKLKLNELKSSRLNLENGVDLSKMDLCRNIGLESETYKSFEIQKPDIREPENPITLYIDHNAALQTRAENILLNKNVEASELQTKIKRADYMPKVAIWATYYQQDMMDTWEGNSMAFISVSIPLSDWWGGSYAIKKQKINEQIAVNDRSDIQQQLLVQMQKVRNDLDEAYKQVLIAREAINQSTENLRLNDAYYRAGTVKLTDLLDAQTFLQQSRDRYVEKYTIYQRKRVEYLLITGR